MIPGGFTESRMVDEKVREIAIKMKGDIEKVLEEKYFNYQPETYQSKVVEGTVYLITIAVDAAIRVIAEIYEDLSGNCKVVKAKKKLPNQ